MASHAVSTEIGGHTTDPEHQPDGHRAYAERTPDSYRAWAASVGPSTLAVVERQFARVVPALGLPACDVLRKLARVHGSPALEAAAKRAVEIQSLTVKSVKSLLASGKHLRGRPARSKPETHLHHPNVRGGDYYGQPGQEG